MDRTPSNLLNVLSLSDLETLIQTIVRRILQSELHPIQSPQSQPTQTAALLATFGTWEDDRPVETIINDIYSSRTVRSLDA
jgi:hypothetical protein